MKDTSDSKAKLAHYSALWGGGQKKNTLNKLCETQFYYKTKKRKNEREKNTSTKVMEHP